MAGLEVDAVEPAAPAFSGVVVGEIAASPTPSAGRQAAVCTVDVGDGEPLQIVCGAPNARAGLKAPLALRRRGAARAMCTSSAPSCAASNRTACCARRASSGSPDDRTTGMLELPADAPVGQRPARTSCVARMTAASSSSSRRTAATASAVLGMAREVGDRCRRAACAGRHRAGGGRASDAASRCASARAGGLPALRRPRRRGIDAARGDAAVDAGAPAPRRHPLDQPRSSTSPTT